MDTNFNNRKEDIIKKLQVKVPNLRCPACGQTNFTVAEGYFAHDLQSDLVNRYVGGKNVPVVPIACKHCGLMLEFAAGVLGILPHTNTSSEE